MKILNNIFRFKGEVHPPDHKQATADLPIQPLPKPATIHISTSQHLGAPATPCVEVGDEVIADQLIATNTGFISANIHSPLCGKVAKIEPAPTPTGQTAASIVIEVDTERNERDESLAPIVDWQAAAPADLRQRIAAAGVVGMGGAGFPTHIKLTPPSDRAIDTVILNSAECEPYLTGDNRLIIEKTARIVEGCEIIRYILGAKRICFAIEDNKPQAIAALQKALADKPAGHELHALRTIYPQGSEKQQIFSVTGRTVPVGKLPMDVGCVVNNVSTALAIQEAVVEGRPLTHRIITVSGGAVHAPANWLAPIGTFFAQLAEASGGTRSNLAKAISGGPMMGFALGTLDLAMTKTSSGLVLQPDSQVTVFTGHPCINCARCIDVCPMRLLPNELSQAIEADDIEEAERLHVMDCFECGSCAYVCPARRPLVQHMRRAKTVVMRKRRAQAAKTGE